MSFASQLDAAAAATTCQVLQNAGGALVGYGAVSLFASGVGLVPLTLGSAALLASNYACTWDPEGGTGQPFGDWCWDTTDGRMTLAYYNELDILAGFVRNNIRTITNITKTGQTNSYGSFEYRVDYISTAGAAAECTFYEGRQADGFFRYHRTVIEEGTCTSSPGSGIDPGPYTHVDPDSGCSLDVSWLGVAVDAQGNPRPIYKIEPAPSPLRASGGVIGGCNFEPVIYVGGGGGSPPTYGPWDPEWPDWDGQGDPPWKDFLEGLLGGLVAGAIQKALDELFKTPYPASSKQIYAACNKKEDDSPETFSVNFPEEVFTDRVLTALDAITDFQQQILLWKTPVCMCGSKPVTGDPVTVTWASDEASPTSGDRVRKIFTYFDHSGSSQLDHLNWWKDFSWQAGPVVVSCCGTPLGKPQVWAASADEGKRVIQRAAAIAQVDLKDAEWLVGTPRSSRYGLSGTMRVHRSQDGGFWVTKRNGPDGAPIVLS